MTHYLIIQIKNGTIAFLFLGYLSPNSLIYLLCFYFAQISIYENENKVNPIATYNTIIPAYDPVNIVKLTHAIVSQK